MTWHYARPACGGTIKRNRAKCNRCQAVVESTDRWTEVRCKCGRIAVSGGTGEGAWLGRDYFEPCDVTEMVETW